MPDWEEGLRGEPSFQMTTSPSCSKSLHNSCIKNIIFRIIYMCVCVRARAYQTITAEGIASRTKLKTLFKASFENPVQVFAHEEENLT